MRERHPAIVMSKLLRDIDGGAVHNIDSRQ